MRYKLIFIILFFTTCFLRLYNIQTTARFTRDESSDLVNIKKIYDARKVTLIGPIGEGNVAIFSSLTYYLCLPFTILFNFDPISPVIATSFFGIVTVLLIWKLLSLTNFKHHLLFLIPVFIFPYLESSRWAWNPHFIPFWQVIGLILFYLNIPFNFLLSGLAFGLTIHQHWYAAFSCLGVAILLFAETKKIKTLISFGLGLTASIFPFALFDLTHPPGLFFSRMINFTPISPGLTNTNIISIAGQFFSYLVNNNRNIGIIVFILSLGLILYRQNKYLIPIIFQFIGLSFISTPIANRYLLPGVLFYILWLSQNIKQKLTKIIIVIILVTNIYYLPKVFSQNDWSTNIKALKQITKQIASESKIDNLPFNIIVLQSQDGNTKGSRFRDLLSLQNITPLPPNDYDNPRSLFVISQNTWDNLKTDAAYEINNFRSDTPTSWWKIDNSVWFLYKVNKN
ncbi:MAG: hypothetical protein WC841_01890 [Candidatus Shapirobacteria bacterium]|jgi:hypothetical protein